MSEDLALVIIDCAGSWFAWAINVLVHAPVLKKTGGVGCQLKTGTNLHSVSLNVVAVR